MGPKFAITNEWMNEREVIEFLGLDDRRTQEQARESLRWLTRKHGLPVAKFGRTKMFKASALRAYLDKRAACA